MSALQGYHCLSPCIVAHEKQVLILMFVLLYRMSFFFLSALNVFSLLPFEYDMSRCISVFVFSFWYLFCLLFSELFYLWFDVFHDFWKFLVITSVNICRTSFLLSSPFEIHIIYMLDNFILFYSFWMLCTLSLLFFSLSWSCFYRFILKWIFLINWVNW